MAWGAVLQSVRSLKGRTLPDEPNKPTASEKSVRSRSEIAALVLVGLVTAAVVLTYFVPSLRVCRDHVLDTGAVVRACQPVGVDDALTIGLILLFAILLMPNVVELGVPGGITLKRRVEAVHERVARLDEKVDRLVIAQEMSVSNTIIVADPREYLESMPRKAAAFEQSKGAITEGIAAREAAREDRVISDDRAVLESRLVRAYARLEPFLGLSGTYRGRVPADLPDNFIGPLRAWREAFAEEISIVRATRNAVVHDPWRVSDEQVGAAIDLAERLWRILEADVLGRDETAPALRSPRRRGGRKQGS
jgi:hypothetical protein